MQNPQKIKTLLDKYSQPIPRYTSYPTAPYFSDQVTAATFKDSLNNLPDGQNLSLYFHIPYCDTLCWFCGCHTKITQKYQPIAEYLVALKAEITTIANLIKQNPTAHPVSHIHFGGGSPTILSPIDFTGLMQHIKSCFSLAKNAEIAVEIDPRDIQDDMLHALADSGINRISVGVQDFDPEVQKAINRIQTFKETKHVIDKLAKLGVNNVNIDIIYGLPKQDVTKILDTAQKSISLGVDRIALFGYAHVPWMKTHQKLILTEDLPNAHQRYEQAEAVAAFLKQNGLQQIGLDHFAKADDSMSTATQNGSLKRNFQGYTTDEAAALIGFGASSISSLPNGYFQNQPSLPSYMKAANKADLTTVKGLILTTEDHVRRDIIEKIMCQLKITRADIINICKKYNFDGQHELLETYQQLTKFEADELIEQSNDGFTVPEHARIFLRVIAAHFDAYLAPTSEKSGDTYAQNNQKTAKNTNPARKGRHSLAI